MGLFDIFGFLRSKKITPVDWVKHEEGHFHRLKDLDPLTLAPLEGSYIYIIWHGGAKPGWVYIAASEDLATDLSDVQQNEEIVRYHGVGGLRVTWASFTKTQLPGCFAFLNDILMPEVLNPDAEIYASADPRRILPPGYNKETFLKAFET